MHLSLEFALLMSRSDIHVFALREYFTKALMPLDREPHKQMQVGWSHLKSRFAAEHGHSVSNQFQALALIREAWAAGTQAKHILTGWRQTGIVPWCPNELLVEQAQSLFRSQHQAVKDHKFMDRASKDVLRLPNTMMERKITCKACKTAILQRFRHCTDCGALNEAYSADASCVMQEGRRKGFKKIRPSAFNIQELVEKNFQGLRAVSDAGKAALENGSSSSSESCSDGDSVPEVSIAVAAADASELKLVESTAKLIDAGADTSELKLVKSTAKVAKPAVPAAKPDKYDPPTYIPSQLKSQTGLKRAWGDVLQDVSDAKHKKAFVHWVPAFMELAKQDLAEHFAKGTPKEMIYKSILDKVAKKSPEDRHKWYTQRVAIMLESLHKQEAKQVKTK